MNSAPPMPDVEPETKPRRGKARRRLAETLSAVAREFSVSVQAVSAWTYRPEWPFAKAPPWDLDAIREWRDQNATTRATAAEKGENTRDAERAARIGLLVERRAKLALERLIQEGQYVKRDTVRREWAAAVHKARDLLLGIPRRLAHDLTPDDPGPTEARIEAAITAALEGLAK